MRTQTRFVLIGLLAFGAMLLHGASAQHAQVLANSLKDFSATQGENNWYYGYYPSGDPSSFQPMTACPTDFGGVWSIDCPATNTWTIIDAIGGVPGSTDLPVRRWVSNVSGEITISGRLAKGDWDCGDGLVGRIIVDGTTVWEQTVDFFDSVGVWYSVSVQVNTGSTVDFVIDPGFNNWCDHAVFTATISREPLEGDVNGDDRVDDADLLIVLFNFGNQR
ncbi:hypothetical protein HRbin15_02540 [bacterium HR15]|nr:hypothetical protein HRbin15_02540 [bacterium HR15]